MIVELVRQARRRRTLVAFAALVVIPAVVVVALLVNGPPTAGRTPDLIDVASRSGLNFATFALVATSQFLLVVVVALFAGDTVASEAQWGSLRYLLTRPVRRARLLRVKLSAAVLYGLLAVVVVPLVSLGIGSLAFGWSGLVTPLGAGLGPGAALARLTLGVLYVAANMGVVVAVAFCLSTYTDTPLGAVGGAVLAIVVSQVLDAVSALGVVRYGLPTHYWLAWLHLLDTPVEAAQMWRGLALDAPWTVLPLALAFRHFGRKDILS